MRQEHSKIWKSTERNKKNMWGAADINTAKVKKSFGKLKEMEHIWITMNVEKLVDECEPIFHSYFKINVTTRKEKQKIN